MQSVARLATTLCAFVALTAISPAFGQTIVATTKPLGSGWLPTDFASFEVRLTGRKGADLATVNRIVGRIPLKTFDFSILTQRVTILIPANEVWEIKGLTLHFVPLNTTGVKPYDIAPLDFATSFHPPSGQVLAIDVDIHTGIIMMGPVTVAVAPDTLPPVASITFPTAGATVSGTVNLIANATDNVGVVGVQFGLDGVSYAAEITTPPYTTVWNSTTVADGAHMLNVVARDAAGNRTSSAVITLTVSNVGISPVGSTAVPGQTVTTAQGVWSFDPVNMSSGGNVILLNGQPAVGSGVKFIIAADGLRVLNNINNLYLWNGSSWTQISP